MEFVKTKEEEMNQYERVRKAEVKIMRKRNEEQQRKAEKRLLNAQMKEVWEDE